MNVVITMPGELESGAERVDQALHGYLAERGKSIETLGLAEARSAWLASARECKANAGHGCQGFDGAARVLARRLGENREYELLIVPYLLFRPARIRLNNVAWDGVERPLERINDSPDHNPVESVPIEGPSLAVFAFSSNGEKLFQGVGGLDLAHRLHVLPDKRSATVIHWRIELRDDLFSDPALLREGVAIALDPLLPRSDTAAQ